MADATAALDGARQKFVEQIEFFRAKLNLPTETWRDIQKSAHDKSFVVAGAMKADLLNDLRAAVDQVVQGGSIGDFRKRFKAAVEKSGWTGWTGEGTKAGEAWRTKVIYQTNMATSYAAGRRKQLLNPALLSRRPFWRYIHDDSVTTPRPQHKAWGDANLTLRHDHPFWDTHFPPNGWGCKCRIVAVKAPADGDATEPPAGWTDTDPKTGAPVGIDEGWDYAPGASVQNEAKKLLDAKTEALPPELADALRKEVEAELLKPVFVEAKTAKEAAEWAVQNNLADFADYNGIKPEVANDWNKSLFDHMREFPELRKNQKYTGTIQGQLKRWRELEIENYIKRIRQQNPNLSPDFDLRASAERQFKPLKTATNTYAHSWMQPTVSGVSVNKKYGADPAAFTAALKRDVQNKWHPVGADTIRSVVDHELGHQLDALLGLEFDPDVLRAYKAAQTKNMKEEVSGYAGKNVKEYIAECWAEVCNSPAPRPHAAAIGALIRARYRAKFGSS